LNLQIHHITDPEVKNIFRESQNRLITMALIHQELYQADDLAHLDFAHYIKNVVENLFVSYGVHKDRIGLHLNLESVRMVVDTAIPVGLIVTELVSNALKHAFAGGRTGNLHIVMKTKTPTDYSLRIEDDGLGLPEGMDIGTTKSLGLRIVCMICEQLGGTISVERGKGTAFCLVFPEYHEAGAHLH
jgi:two-component sensor histidine kinase